MKDTHRSPEQPHANPAGGHVQSLSRALTILNELASPGEGLSLSEIASRVGLSTSTSHRLLTTLEHERYVRFDTRTKRWFVGFQAFVSGSAFAHFRDVNSIARPHMRALMEICGETVNLGCPAGNTGVALAQVPCRQMVRTFTDAGTAIPFYCSGMGKAMLSAMYETQIEAILRNITLERFTSKTLTTSAKLHRELKHIQQRGYAIDDEEHALGVRCVAAPVFDEGQQVVAAISICGPIARLENRRLPSLGREVNECARQISTELGGRWPSHYGFGEADETSSTDKPRRVAAQSTAPRGGSSNARASGRQIR